MNTASKSTKQFPRTLPRYTLPICLVAALGLISGCLSERGSLTANTHNSESVPSFQDNPAPSVPHVSTSVSISMSSSIQEGEYTRRAEAIEHASSYLSGICSSQGKFTYRVNLDPEVQVTPKYNVLRHAGTMYALGMAYDFNPNSQVRRTLLQAG